jgi:hypothetical protein
VPALSANRYLQRQSNQTTKPGRNTIRLRAGTRCTVTENSASTYATWQKSETANETNKSAGQKAVISALSLISEGAGPLSSANNRSCEWRRPPILVMQAAKHRFGEDRKRGACAIWGWVNST